ncbi:phospholipase D family protein [Sphingopyxis sp. YF1]|uniref:phospholipase D family protein n=1 Tax=Sphingopyxis sp. YF1 TaxID=2482763 RepID=UPI001F60615C|nr:phospholipase D family protein [Sphingopyxis sp. YF1]UNU44311.1 phospholipase D family protein [Sphingopyxis sp. YF1]
MLTALVFATGSFVLLALVLWLAFPLPSLDGRRSSEAISDPAAAVAAAIAPVSAQHPGQSGIYLLPDALDAFAARVEMIRAAERSVDLQYYIWNDDLSGRLLLAELVKAADRGVRVRLLIDDNTTAGLDPLLAGANAHPQIEVRLFNPLSVRRVRAANYLFAFPRLNRRMHNKSLTIDGAVTIVGGRNVGDEYFGAEQDGLFIDMDALAIGAVLPEVSAQFDRYWNSRSAYPAELLIPAGRAIPLAALRNPPESNSARGRQYRQAIAQTAFIQDAMTQTLNWQWTGVQLFSDDPAKALGAEPPESLLVNRLKPAIAEAQDSFDLVSGYFVPADLGTGLLTGLARRGVDTLVVTNSFAVTDVPLVHAGYIKKRKPLLDAGVQLFEVRPGTQDRTEPAEPAEHSATRFSGGGESLHAKTFVVDRRRLFVGSFNFDPRSAELNCEMGFLIDSPYLAGLVADGLRQRLSDHSYAVTLSPKGQVQWIDTKHGKQEVLATEPGTTAWNRASVWLLSHLPIDWLL